jgi:hypothetical protein
MADKPPKVRKGTLKDVVSRPQVRPTFGAILDHFFGLIGGPEKFAKMLLDDYNSAPAGSLTRGKIIDILARGLKTEDAKAGIGDDLGMLAEEDLMRELERREALIRPHLETPDEPAGPARPQEAVRPPARPAGRDPAAAPAPPAGPAPGPRVPG